MAEQIYKVQTPDGLREIAGPQGASDEQIIEQAKILFSSTPGGAAVGNPNAQRQGDRQRRTTLDESNPAGTILGAGGAGLIGGLAAPEILTGLGGAAAAFPVTAPAAPFLTGAGNVLRGQRLISGAAGLVGGLAGETAGQVVEQSGGSQMAAEAARLAAGGIAPEAGPLASVITRKLGGITGLSEIPNILRRLAGKEPKQSEAQQEYLAGQIAGLRGAEKTDAPLTAVGNVMGDEAARLTAQGQQQVASAAAQRANVPRFGPVQDREFADIGEELRGIIAPRFEAGKAARDAEYQATQKLVNDFVGKRESAGQFVSKTPEYEAMVAGLKTELESGKRSPDVQAGIKYMLGQLENPSKDIFGQNKPTSFQALDDIRRKLGDVFKGKPSEGYSAIGDNMARDLYGKISDIQKKFAGGENGPQAKLLQDYANSSEALAMFRSKTGKKATALDLYNEAEYVTDASKLPATYFKTRAGINQLRELTGNLTAVNKAAMEYANKEIRTLDSADAIGSWMNRNSEFLQAMPQVRTAVSRYMQNIRNAEVAVKNADDFAATLAKDASLLTKNKLPAQRAVELITSGNTEMWGKIAPALMASPQAKQQLVMATRQVLADQAKSAETINLFNRSIRGFLENSNLASKAELDSIAQRLVAIQEMKVPESEKLGMAKRLLLQSTGSWYASAMSRAGMEGYNYMANQVPEYESPLVKKIPK